MAHYLVRSRPYVGRLPELGVELTSGKVAQMSPFGRALDRSLRNAKWESTGVIAIWEEEDYCHPPLAQEREAVLDKYFEDIQVSPVTKGEGWAQIDHLPSVWSEEMPDAPAGEN